MKRKKNFLYNTVEFFGIAVITVLIIPAGIIFSVVRLIWRGMDVLLEKLDDSEENAEEI